MSNTAQQMMDEFENKRNTDLAKLLGISLGELNATDWDFEEEEDNDGNILNTGVRFSQDSPREILDKIEGLESDNIIWLGINPFEPGEDDEDFKPDEQ